jgi:processive 1,2-diacylglycerol beta-glucosyltransferase
MISAATPHRTRVMIVSDDPSGGHRAAAKAVNEALGKFSDVETHVYEFQDLSPKPRQAFRRGQMDFMLTHHDLTRFLHRHSMKPGPLYKAFVKSMTWVNQASMQFAQKAVKEENPDVLLSTHMGTNGLSGFWQKNNALQAPAHCVVTDFLAVGVWKADNIQRYYVASEAVKKDLMSYGVDESKVLVTGIPVSSKISEPDLRDREEVKKSLGLDPKKEVILIMGGSRGDQQYVPILEAIEKKGGTQAQVVAVCGKSAERFAEVEAFAKTSSFPVHPRPFVDMRDYYHATDIVVTKPGGLTTAEVLAKGKALIVVSPYAGMEETQVERLTQVGVAKYGETPETTADLALGLLADPKARESLEANAKAFGRPDAAAVIAQDLRMTGQGAYLAKSTAP